MSWAHNRAWHGVNAFGGSQAAEEGSKDVAVTGLKFPGLEVRDKRAIGVKGATLNYQNHLRLDTMKAELEFPFPTVYQRST